MIDKAVLLEVIEKAIHTCDNPANVLEEYAKWFASIDAGTAGYTNDNYQLAITLGNAVVAGIDKIPCSE